MAAVVVVGAGQAGQQAATALRAHGHSGRVVLVGEETASPVPYERPPLSKAFLTGSVPENELWPRPPAHYARHAIELVHGAVTDLGRAERAVHLADGRTYAYDRLILATGSTPRVPPVPGVELRGVHALRTLADARAIRADLAEADRVVVIGAGYLGLECAAAFRATGRRVTVVEALDRPLSRVAGARTAAHVARLHRERGTELLYGRRVRGLHGRGGRVASVELDDGAALPADLVLVAVGVTPRTGLAREAGLAVTDGVTVDARLRTADPAVSAIGDCAAYPDPRTGVPVRLESVPNALAQAEYVASGVETPYAGLPWFWSGQFDSTVQIAGLGGGHDTEVPLGEEPSGAFSVLLFRGPDLLAVESVNRPGDHMAARRLLAAAPPSLTPDEAMAPGFTLKGHARERATV
ncbi:NAD(P)/FAD-dependent oxidoreductase [Streptomyces sp. NPDC048172]|uniref:NAD(P)/FAD-dependent oxidoreductase n=1 Tax=Streptomyces sp. NPDC048172 TaxID=3365505 RepID=UPI00371B52F8